MKIEIDIECPACKATGVYTGMGERDGAAVVCRKCNGTGKYHYSYSYECFVGRRLRDDVKRVYLSGYGFVVTSKKIKFEGIGTIDMNKEGVSYKEFLSGKTPKHIEKLGCPMRADQSACHKIKGFVDKCEELNGGWILNLSECKYAKNKSECWKRFHEE